MPLVIVEARTTRRIGFLACALALAISSPSIGVAGKKNASIMTIPISDFAIEDTTVTVTVMEDPLALVMSLLEVCDSLAVDEQGQEDEFAEKIRRLCRTVERVTRAIEAPPQELRPGDYIVTVPLTQPRGTFQAAIWKSTTLDEAITFVDLLKGGKLRAVSVYQRYPPSSQGGTACDECPIKDLIFSAGSIKEQREILK